MGLGGGQIAAVPPGLEVGQGWGGRSDVRGASGQHPPFPHPVSSQGLPHPPWLPVDWGGGGGRVVCVSLKPGSCADESRLNVEPPAVLSRPTLTHLSPKVLHPLTEGSGACPMPGGNLDAPKSIMVLAQCLESKQGTGVGAFSWSFQVSTQPKGSAWFLQRGGAARPLSQGHLCPSFLSLLVLGVHNTWGC